MSCIRPEEALPGSVSLPLLDVRLGRSSGHNTMAKKNKNKKKNHATLHRCEAVVGFARLARSKAAGARAAEPIATGPCARPDSGQAKPTVMPPSPVGVSIKEVHLVEHPRHERVREEVGPQVRRTSFLQRGGARSVEANEPNPGPRGGQTRATGPQGQQATDKSRVLLVQLGVPRATCQRC